MTGEGKRDTRGRAKGLSAAVSGRSGRGSNRRRAARPPETGRAQVERLVFRGVTAARWADFERLFGGRGGPKYCWCMAWRATAAEVKLAGGTPRKAAIRRRVSAGVPIGILGYLGGEPVAWCSIAPRSTYRRLVSGNSPDEGVWSIACFFIKRDLRRRGITLRLIDAAVEEARRRRAIAVEAYPVDPDSPSYRFMGFVETFKKAGFTETGREGTRRHVMRLIIGQTKSPGRSTKGKRPRRQ